VIFVPPCRGSPTDWHLRISIDDVNQETQKVVERIENEYRSEDIMLSNISRLTIGTPGFGQLIDSMPSKEVYAGSRNAEIIYEVTRGLKNKFCRGYINIQ